VDEKAVFYFAIAELMRSEDVAMEAGDSVRSMLMREIWVKLLQHAQTKVEGGDTMNLGYVDDFRTKSAGIRASAK